jgi:hypothetical protein
MKKVYKMVLFSGTLITTILLAPYTYTSKDGVALNKAEASAVAVVKSPFTYSCGVPGRLSESANSNESTSPYWWLNSGAYMYLANGECSTVSGNLSLSNIWRQIYQSSDPIDTDSGLHPQNLFRLVTRAKWGGNISQQISVKTTALNKSASLERNAWSGILLFNRYQNGDNLYYAGIRDDGHAVIKSKKNGVYKTLAEVPYFAGTYNRLTNPTLLPMNQWIAIKTEVSTNPDNSVSIKLYVDKNNSGNFTLATSAVDRTNPILSSGYAGLRLDFRDAQFDNFKISSF